MTAERLEQTLAAREQTMAGAAPTLPRRKAALAEFAAAGLPTPRRENWRYTDLKSLAAGEFELTPPRPDRAALAAAPALIATAGVQTDDAARLVFIDGHLVDELGTALPAGLELRDLAAHWDTFVERYSARIAAGDHPLASLNTAFVQQGVWLCVRDGVRIGTPVHLVFAGSARPGAAPQPRVIVELGRGSALTIVQHFVDADGAGGWLNAVTQIDQAADSQLTLCRVQRHAVGQAHTSLLSAELGARAQLSACYIDLGGRLVRNDVDVKLREPGAIAELFGVFVAAAGQHIDNHTRIDHLAPETRSDETFRGIVGHRGRGVFNGKVVVHRNAQRIDARQSNDNLLLADNAEIDTKPELEIYADDVKCSHGSTVGELDEDHLFYLRSRGLDENGAREMLTTAFAAAVLERIGDAAFRDVVSAQVTAHLRAVLEAQP